MTISNKNIALSVVSGFMLVGLMGNVFISNVIKPKPSNLDFSAFVNLSRNIEYIANQKPKLEEVERLKIEEFAIAGIERKIEIEIANNKVFFKKQLAIKKQMVATVEKEFQLSDEVKLAFSGLKKVNPKIEIEAEKIESNQLASIPSLNNEISENKFKAEKINSLDMSVLDNLKDSYDLPSTKEVLTIKESITTDDDLVVFDYPNENETEKKFDKKLYDRPISNAVRNVIQREIKSNPVKVAPISKPQQEKTIDSEVVEAAITRIDAKNKAVEYLNEKEDEQLNQENDEQIVYEYSTPSEIRKESKVANNFLANEATRPVELNLKALEVNNQSKRMINSIGFEFEPDYDRNERLYDNNSGNIQISFNSTEALNETSGVVFKQGFIPTRIDLANDNDELKVPMFGEEGFEQRFNIDSNNRNSILISRTEGVEDIDIDSEYSNKLLLDNKFNIVKSNPAFIMFTSVKTGNVLVRYNHIGKTAQKIVFVGEGEIYFQAPKFIDGERETFELTTKNLLANNEKNLEIDSRDLKVFNTNTYSKKQALNVYELMMPKQVLGNRKYLELSKQGNDIFIGVDGPGKLQIPNKEYIGKVLESFNTKDLTDRCLIQFNFKSPIANFKVAGKNRNGEMYTETMVLDQDGNLLVDDYSSAEKIFVLGEQEGQVSIHAESESGSIINAKSFCSNGTYLIEQF